MSTHIAKIVCILLANTLQAQAQAPATGSREVTSVKQSFEELRLRCTDPSSASAQSGLRRIAEKIRNSSSDDVAAAIPLMIGALRGSENPRLCTLVVLFDVSLRPDSAQLLSSYIGPIGNLLNSPDERFQTTPPIIFLNLKPQPPPEVVPPLLTYLTRTDLDPKAQTSALFALAKIAGDNPEVISGIRGFLARPLAKGVRIDALNALGDSRVHDPDVVAMVTASLDDADQGVRFTAAQTLRNMGEDAVRQAEPALQKVIERADEAPEVKDAARAALKSIGRTSE